MTDSYITKNKNFFQKLFHPFMENRKAAIDNYFTFTFNLIIFVH